MKDIVKIDPAAAIIVASHSTLSGVSMGTLTVRITDAQGFLHDILLSAIYVPGLGFGFFPGCSYGNGAGTYSFRSKTEHTMRRLHVRF